MPVRARARIGAERGVHGVVVVGPRGQPIRASRRGQQREAERRSGRPGQAEHRPGPEQLGGEVEVVAVEAGREQALGVREGVGVGRGCAERVDGAAEAGQPYEVGVVAVRAARGPDPGEPVLLELAVGQPFGRRGRAVCTLACSRASRVGSGWPRWLSTACTQVWSRALTGSSSSAATTVSVRRWGSRTVVSRATVLATAASTWRT